MSHDPVPDRPTQPPPTDDDFFPMGMLQKWQRQDERVRREQRRLEEARARLVQDSGIERSGTG